MKLLKLTFIALLMGGSFVACKKDKAPETPEVTIYGKWTGKYIEANTTFYVTILEQSNEFQIMNKQNPAEVANKGTWKLEGTTFTAEYENEVPGYGTFTQSYTAKFNSKTGKLTNGILIDEAYPTETLTWYLDKQP